MKPYDENKKLRIIEMVSGPGAGKSCAAHFLAGYMKAEGMKVEFVSEFAKAMVWDGRHNDDHSIFTEQDYMLAHQNNMFRRLLSHDIDYVVTDTSILLGLIYTPLWFPKSFKDFLLDVHTSYNNITFLVDRGDIPYVPEGRNQTYTQALKKDEQAEQLLLDLDIDYQLVKQSKDKPDGAALQMLQHIKSLQNNR